jgi:mannose-6-phosphate isomerase-like protein (cupin superfamily)
MKRDHLEFSRRGRASVGNERSQAAQMVLAPGAQDVGGGDGRRGSDRWLFVIEGAGVAIINGERYPLRPGSLFLIERGDEHEIRSTGRTDLKTLNVYVPPVKARARGDPSLQG